MQALLFAEKRLLWTSSDRIALYPIWREERNVWQLSRFTAFNKEQALQASMVLPLFWLFP